jgi:S1-C subfamily serine protease
MDSTKTLGNIGLPILSRFRLAIDYGHDRLWALPDPASIREPFVKDRLGLHLKKVDQGFTAELVSPGSPAAAAGFKTGDAVTLVDGKSRDGWPGRLLQALADGPPGPSSP